MLALHPLQSALVHVNTLLVQTVLDTPAFHDRMGVDERRLDMNTRLDLTAP